MTNFEYIINNLTEKDIVSMVFSHGFDKSEFVDKIYDVWQKWAESFSPNTGNMAKGCFGSKDIIENNPSIWLFEKWAMPDGSWKRKGRTSSVSMQVWLSLQYNPKDWE